MVTVLLGPIRNVDRGVHGLSATTGGALKVEVYQVVKRMKPHEESSVLC